MGVPVRWSNQSEAFRRSVDEGCLEPHRIEITLFGGVNGGRITVTGAAPGGSHTAELLPGYRVL